MLQTYFKGLYQRTMREAYTLAHKEIILSLREGGKCLDCGASNGYMYDFLESEVDLKVDCYCGIAWDEGLVLEAQRKKLNVVQEDLNKGVDYPDNQFRCIFGLSVLEHLLNPCKFLRECYRALEQNGSLIILTPNISTYFTAILILLGKMPSSGPHPDSDQLLKQKEIFEVNNGSSQYSTEGDTPTHRHLVVFSYSVLISYLKSLGFKDVKGYGFGLYPFPNLMQPVLEKIDPYHCHQMVMIAKK